MRWPDRQQAPALDNTLVEKRIRNAVATRLGKKDLRETAERPDLLERVPAGWRLRRTRIYVDRYTEGTLVLDLWRATCTDTASDPGKLEKRIDSDVKKAFEKFPPKKKQLRVSANKADLHPKPWDLPPKVCRDRRHAAVTGQGQTGAVPKREPARPGQRSQVCPRHRQLLVKR